MRLINTSRLEYVKQPHIILLIVAIIAVILGALITANNRIQDNKRRSTLDSISACLELVDDEVLCQFAARNEQSSNTNTIVTTTLTDGNATEVTTSRLENPNRTSSVTKNGTEEVESFIVIDDVTYVKDYASNSWAMYKDPNYSAVNQNVKYDFSNQNSQDVLEFKNLYKKEGMEPCGQFNCYKYRIIDSENADATDYVWIDDKEFLLRRHMSMEEGLTTNSQFEYQTVTIEAPSPTREVSAEEIEAFLNQD